MKFLIIRFSSIGDIVLTTPVIRCLRKKFPESQIHYLTKESFAGIVENNPYLNRVHVLREDINETIEELKKENFNYIIDLHHNLRTLRIKNALKNVRSFSFNKLNLEKWVYVNFKINILPRKHIVERYIETMNSLSVVNDGLGLDYFIPEKDVVKKTDLPTSHVHGYIGIVIGAAHNTKKLPVNKLKELCIKIQHPIILLGNKEDHLRATQISSVDSIKIYNACGKFNLNESADLIRNARLIISNDTGLMHIAAAFKKTILSVWGNTVPSFGMVPYYGRQQIESFKFQVNKLWCRPCSKIGFAKCPLGHFKCMNKIQVEEIILTVEKILGNKNSFAMYSPA